MREGAGSGGPASNEGREGGDSRGDVVGYVGEARDSVPVFDGDCSGQTERGGHATGSADVSVGAGLI